MMISPSGHPTGPLGSAIQSISWYTVTPAKVLVPGPIWTMNEVSKPSRKSDAIDILNRHYSGGITKNKFNDVAEMKQNDPEAHGAYQRATGGRRGVGVPLNQRLMPAVPGAPQLALPPLLPDELLNRHQQIRKRHEERLKQHRERIQQLREAQPVPPAVL